MGRLIRRTPNQPDQHQNRPPPHLPNRLLNSSQRRRTQNRLRHIIKTHHRKIIRHPKPQASRSLDSSDSSQIIGREHSSRPIRQRKQLSSSSQRHERVIRTDPKQPIINRDPSRAKGGPIPLLPQPSRLKIRTPGQHPDPPMPQPEQVLDRDLSTLQIVRVNGRKLRRPSMWINSNDRRTVVDIDHGRRHQHSAIDQRPGQSRQIPTLPANLITDPATSRVHHELEPAPADRIRRPLQQLSAERLEIGHQDADDVRLVVAKALRDQTRLVPELVDHLPHARVSSRRDTVAFVDHLRYGRHRDTCARRDIADRDSSTGLHRPRITT